LTLPDPKNSDFSVPQPDPRPDPRIGLPGGHFSGFPGVPAKNPPQTPDPAENPEKSIFLSRPQISVPAAKNRVPGQKSGFFRKTPSGPRKTRFWARSWVTPGEPQISVPGAIFRDFGGSGEKPAKNPGSGRKPEFPVPTPGSGFRKNPDFRPKNRVPTYSVVH